MGRDRKRNTLYGKDGVGPLRMAKDIGLEVKTGFVSALLFLSVKLVGSYLLST